jgi:transposase
MSLYMNLGDQRRNPPEFRRWKVELVRTGMTRGELVHEFVPLTGAICSWVKQADLDEGRRTDGLTTDERAELRRLKREVRQLRMEREIQEKPRAGSPGRAPRSRSGVGFVRAHEAEFPVLAMCHVLGLSPSGATRPG